MSTARPLILLILLGFIAACGHLPEMKTLDPRTDQVLTDVCESPYIKVPYRYVHTIEATLPGGRSATMIGVTVVDPVGKALHSVLMTLEGLVLFDGESVGAMLQVNRAVPPFDKESFARNMMEDVRLLFLPPEDPALAAGILGDGSTLCRRKGNAGETIDVRIRPDRTWKMETYATPFERQREAEAANLTGGIPGEIDLQGHSQGNYALHLKLISAEPVSGESSPTEPGEGTDNE